MKRSDLAKRLQPLVDAFARELTAIVQTRIDNVVAHAEDAIENALSAIVADLENLPEEHGCCPRMAHAGDGHDPSCSNFVREVAAAPVRAREVKPENHPPSRRAREDRAAPQANGKKPVICRKCGFVGGNARGRGTAHPTQTTATTHAAPAISAATPDRLATIAALASKPAMRPQAVERAPGAEPDVFEEDEPLADRIARAEASKRDGALPQPRSTFLVDRGEVEELDFGGQR